MGSTATILHADLDAFYASVEQLLDPRLRGKPIAVGGGVVLAASYEARAFGVRSGIPGRRARQLCPDLVFVGGHFDEYQRLGDAAIGVLSDFTPPSSASPSTRPSPTWPGARISSVRRQRWQGRFGLACRRAGLPMSIGVARPAPGQIASQVAKPDGLVVVDRDTELEFLHGLPVALMWVWAPPPRRGSPRSASRLSVNWLRALLSPWSDCLGTQWEEVDGPRVEPRSAANPDTPARALCRRTIGARTTARDRTRLQPTLHHLADRIGARLRAKSLAGRTITVRVRFADLRSVTRALTLSAPISATRALAEVAEDCGARRPADHRDERTISLLAISVFASRRACDRATGAAARAC